MSDHDKTAAYTATDADLPSMFSEKPSAPPNRVDRTKARIQKCAHEMGIDVSEAELEKFALILLGLASDAKAVMERLEGNLSRQIEK
jgi:hypothetical protein